MPENSGNISIVWNRIKKPFSFVVITLIAVFFLGILKNSKEAYDKNQKKTIVIVDDAIKGDTKSSFQTRAAADLVNVIKQSNEQQKTDELKKSILNENQVEILEKSIQEVKHREFKNKDELQNSINEAVLKNRDMELRGLFNSLALSLMAEHSKRDELTKELVLVKQNLNSYDPGVTYINLKDFTDKKYPNKLKADKLNYVTTKNILYTINDSNGTPDIEVKKLEEEIDKKFREALSDIEPVKVRNEYEKRIEEVGDSYAPIFKNVFLSKNDFLKPVDNENKKRVWLDEKGDLHIAYTLLIITLNTIIIFALLFIILIPLSKIFFLATSSDAISGEAGKYIAWKRSADAGSSVMAGVLPTLTAIGIGAAAITAHQFPSLVDGKYAPDDSALIGSNSVQRNTTAGENTTAGANLSGANKNLYRSFDISNYGFNLSENSIQSITASLNNLQGSMEKLEQRIGDTTFGSSGSIITVPVPVSNPNDPRVQEILEELRRVNGNIGNSSTTGTLLGDLFSINKHFGSSDTREDDKLFGKMNLLTGYIGNEKNQTGLYKNIDNITQSLGNPNEPENDKLFGKLNRISTALGTNDYFVDDDVQNTNLPSISTRLGFIPNNSGVSNDDSADNKPDDKSLLGISRLNQEFILSVQKNQLGAGDRNFITQAKSVSKLFGSENFRVTKIAYLAIKDEIDRAIRASTDSDNIEKYKNLLTNLEKLSENAETFSKEELKKRLTCCNGDSSGWKKWHNLILRLTLVRRY